MGATVSRDTGLIMPLLQRHVRNVFAQAIKAAVAFYSDIFGAVILEWILPVLSFSMLYTSYYNLNKHTAWLSVNSPRVVLWTRYLVKTLIY